MERVSGDLRILKEVDSTNNYAMGLVKSGTAFDGLGVLALKQTAGKGQRGKSWDSVTGDNLLFSMTLEMSWTAVFTPFHLSVVAVVSLWQTVVTLVKESVFLKWPNDLYISDSKAAGILIENVVIGQKWQWGVVGIGLNLNQERFSENFRATSLKNITGENYDLIAVAETLRQQIVMNTGRLKKGEFIDLLNIFNAHLYKKGENVKFRKGAISFISQVKEVSATGELITEDATERNFTFGEVEWCLPAF